MSTPIAAAIAHTGDHRVTTLAPAHGDWRPGRRYLPGVRAAELAEVLLPFAVLAWLATAQRLWRAWPILLIAMILTATMGALFWQMLRTAANQMG